MWKDILKRGKCLLDFHSGEWQYARPGHCDQTQLCVNCGATTRRVEHTWGEWERRGASSCDETRVCSRCGKTEEGVVHEWAAPEFIRDRSCLQMQTCTRCGAEESLPAEHQWEYWEAVEPDACLEVVVCGRCGERGQQQRPAHAWGDWQYSEAEHAAIRVCRRCGELMGRNGQSLGKMEIPDVPEPRQHSLDELVQRRDAIMEPLWEIEEQAKPDEAEVQRIARETVAQIQQLLSQWKDSAEATANGRETGKLHRYLGDALSSLSGKRDKDLLAMARDVYLEGEPLLEAGGDRLELARLNFNLGVALQFMAAGHDRVPMEEARRRYHAARGIFQTEKPETVEQVETALEIIETQLRALRHFEAAQKSRDELQALKETLANAAPEDTATDEKVRRTLKEMERTTPSATEQLDSFRGFFEQAAKVLPQPDDPARTDETRRQLANLAKDLSGGKSNEYDDAFSAIFADLEKETQRGEVSPQRAASLRATLQQFQTIVRTPAKTPEEMATRLGEMRAAIAQFKPIATEVRVRGGRAGLIDRCLIAMRSFLLDETNQSHLGEKEQARGFELLGECTSGRGALKGLEENDPAVIEVERDRLRPAAYAVRRFGLRRHAMYAEPLWGWSDVEVNPNAVFFAGSANLRALAAEVCEERQLQFPEESRAWGAGQLRWNQLRESAVGIFDLSTSSAVEGAAVAHALGSALALGVYPVVIASEQLPFDIDLAATPLGDDPRAALGDALDRAMLGLFPTAGSGELEATARQVLSRVTRSDPASKLYKKRLTEGEQLDPIAVATMLDELINRNVHGKGALIFPAWPPFYPEPETPRCFHVMPFHHDWSNAARDTVRKACTAAGVKYRRGDETNEIRIVHSIWEEICRATHVVVDLTGLNANVCLELALAQALGRKTLLVARDERTVLNLFPEIAKLQVRQYSGKRKIAPLNELVSEFLAGT